jgi:hypothetical protein
MRRRKRSSTGCHILPTGLLDSFGPRQLRLLGREPDFLYWRRNSTILDLIGADDLQIS